MEFPKVYVASREYNYDEWRIEGVFVSAEAAQNALVKSKERYPDNRGRGTEVEEYDLELGDKGQMPKTLAQVFAQERKDQLSEMVATLPPNDLRTLRAIINGKLGKRTITKEQQDKMQAARGKR